MPGIRLEPFEPEMATEATRMLARAFVTNPLHVAAFGPDQLARNEGFFRIALAVMKGPKFVALGGQKILGLIHWIHSPECQISDFDILRMTPALICGLGIRSALRVSEWLPRAGASVIN
jgi:hypothetical protein